MTCGDEYPYPDAEQLACSHRNAKPTVQHDRPRQGNQQVIDQDIHLVICQPDYPSNPKKALYDYTEYGIDHS